MMQRRIELIYAQFKKRVADGRKKDTAYIDSIAQGRVWSGDDAIGIGLVDRFGGIDDAVSCAARLAKVSDYRLREFPETQTIIDRIFKSSSSQDFLSNIKTHLSEQDYKIFEQMRRIRRMTSSAQARLPFEFFIR
jgi:Periplasmic serine proteases (ClpP class)